MYLKDVRTSAEHSVQRRKNPLFGHTVRLIMKNKTPWRRLVRDMGTRKVETEGLPPPTPGSSKCLHFGTSEVSDPRANQMRHLHAYLLLAATGPSVC